MAFTLCDESFVEDGNREEEEARVDGKNLSTSGPNWSGAGGFEVYLWAERTLSVEFELSGGEEGLVGGEEPAVEVDEDDSITTGNAVVRGLE